MTEKQPTPAEKQEHNTTGKPLPGSSVPAGKEAGAKPEKKAEEEKKPKPLIVQGVVISEEKPKAFQTGVRGLFHRLRETILPEIHYLEGEEIQAIIRMADYRKDTPLQMASVAGLGFVISGTVALLGWGLEWPALIQTLAICIVIICLWGIVQGLEDLLLYQQWQFILTNKRIILITPAPDKQWRADAIYLKRGKIQVLDTNWAKSALWGIFQATTGARDVMLSMGGYEFKEEGAQVKGGLRFPDVMPEDILLLENLIFGS